MRKHCGRGKGGAKGARKQAKPANNNKQQQNNNKTTTKPPTTTKTYERDHKQSQKPKNKRNHNYNHKSQPTKHKKATGMSEGLIFWNFLVDCETPRAPPEKLVVPPGSVPGTQSATNLAKPSTNHRAHKSPKHVFLGLFPMFRANPQANGVLEFFYFKK